MGSKVPIFRGRRAVSRLAPSSRTDSRRVRVVRALPKRCQCVANDAVARVRREDDTVRKDHAKVDKTMTPMRSIRRARDGAVHR